MTYEEFDEAVMSLLSDPFADDAELEELKTQEPEHAARMKREADARRRCTYEEYQAQLKAANPPEEKVIFLDGPYKVGDIINDEGEQYRVTQDSFFISSQELVEEAQDESGWHTKASLIHG